MAGGVSRKRQIVVTTIIVGFIFILTRITSLHALATNLQLQEVLPDTLLSSSLLSLKKEDELMKKIEKLNRKLIEKQDARMELLEKQNAILQKELQSLRRPPTEASIREKLVFLYPYDRLVKFPAYIWQSWKHGLNDDRFDEKFKMGETQWAVKNPGFVHELFNDDTANAIIHHLYLPIPEVVKAYDALPEVILRMDFFRYLILFARGGVYADIDTVPLQPVPNWVPENVEPNELGMILGIDVDTSASNWKLLYWRRLQFGQFIIQSKPGHPILREMIAQITETTLQKLADNQLELSSDPHTKGLDIQTWTGAGRWTDVILTFLNDYIQSSVYTKITWKEFHQLKMPKLASDILVLPIKSFALDLEIPKDGKIEDPIAFAKHYAGKIWKST